MRSETFVDNSPLLRKLDSIHPLTAEERRAIMDLPVQLRTIGADQDLVREGDRPSRSCLLLEGFACRYKLAGEDGRRQIMGFYVAGDMPDLMSLHLTVMDNSLATLVPSKVGFVEHEDLRRLMRDHPRIADAFWRDTLIDSAIFREWLVGVGRRSAYARIAHLFCEMFVRMQAVGLAEGDSVRLPITQSTIGDALGLSTVHVNRVLQQLRAHQLIRWERSLLTVMDWDGLQRAGEYDPTYLHLRTARAA